MEVLSNGGNNVRKLNVVLALSLVIFIYHEFRVLDSRLLGDQPSSGDVAMYNVEIHWYAQEQHA